MQTYLVFMRNTNTNEEFVVPHNGTNNSHERVKIEVRNNYPLNKFEIFTAYTLEDLENTLTETKRWPGVASTPQKEAIRNRPFAVSTAIPQVDTGKIEAMLKAKTTKPAPIKANLRPSVTANTANKSVVEMLKAMRA